MKFLEALDGYWLDKEFQINAKTAQRYSYVFDRFIKFMGNAEVEEITSHDVRRFLRHLRKETNLSDRSIFDYHNVLSSFWSWAEKELGIEHIILGKIDKPKFTQRKIDPVPMADVKRLIRACDYNSAGQKRSTATRDKAMITVMVDCGIRVSELCDLNVADHDGQRLHVQHGKGDRERFLPLGRSARRALWRYLVLRSNRQKDEPLFATRGKQRMDRNNVGNLFESLSNKIGIKRVNPHRLRHTFAIEFLRGGGSPFELKEMLGHTTLRMTMNYVKLAEIDLEDAQRRSSPADKWRL